MKKPFFEPTDFKINGWSDERADICCLVANEKLEKETQSWVTVYGSHQDGEWNSCATLRTSDDTHTAKLAFIEELPKKECVHQPKQGRNANTGEWMDQFFCHKCGVELVPTSWSTK